MSLTHHVQTPMSPNGVTPNVPEVPTTLQFEGLSGWEGQLSQIVEVTPMENAPSIMNWTDIPAGKAVTKAKPSTAVTVHHLNNSRSQRLLWLLEELEIPYEIKKYERNEEMRAPQTLKNVHPLGKSPIITDGDVTLAESGAIIEYLLSKYGRKFRPTEAGKIDDLYFTHYSEGTLMPILVNSLIFSIIPQRSPALIRPLLKPVFANIVKRLLNPELKNNCDMLEAHLAKSQTGWLAGGDHPTAADFMMVFPAELLNTRGGEFIGPRVKEYVQRIHDRPAYKRALDKGGKYDYARL